MRTLKRTRTISAAILGCAGVPARYGGFETLAENLVHFHRDRAPHVDLTVYCSSSTYQEKLAKFETATLRYVPLNANGKQAMFYDMWSLIDAAVRGTDVVILLGHGGSFVIPILKRLTKTKFITNIDGIEWRREKWSSLARAIIRKSEAFAVRHSHVVIVDNEAIQEYVSEEFGRGCELIPYGGDHAVQSEPDESAASQLPTDFALGLCRIEPENNVHMILEAFSDLDMPLVFVGNWDNSPYGRKLKRRYMDHPTITIHDPIYDQRSLRAIRENAALYVHGHSAGGTNPALVEMMHFFIPIAAHGCSFNRHTTEGKALYFESSQELTCLVKQLTDDQARSVGGAMGEVAHRRYTWDRIGQAYFDLLEA